MKKLIFPALIVLLVLLIILELDLPGPMIEKPTKPIKITIATGNLENTSFSLKIEDSDFTSNQIILNATIGTLVKYDSKGRISGYLANSWEVSKNNLLWTFHLRDGLRCENGEEINAFTFKESLLKNLKLYHKKGSALTFDYIKGWKEFTAGQTNAPTGITAIDKRTIQFSFDYDPEDFLEILRMPYFGFWVSTSELYPVSSGPYKIDRFTNHSVFLSKRHDWFTILPTSPESLQFEYVSLERIDISDSDILKLPYTRELHKTDPDQNYVVKSPPTRLDAMILSPYKKGLFNSIKNRKIFLAKVNNLKAKYNLELDFYLSAPNTNEIATSSESKFEIDDPIDTITIALERANYLDSEIKLLDSLFKEIFDQQKIPYKLVNRYSDTKLFFERTDTNSFFDIRLSSVDIGANIQNFIIKMMFCSKLGVSFPDPNGKICGLVENRKLGKISAETYEKSFNQYLFEDAVVIPIKHLSENWIVSSRIAPNSFPAVVTFPRFEEIQLVLK